MPCLLIMFEVAEQSTVRRLEQEFESYAGWCQLTDTSWAILSDSKPADVRDELKALLGPKDRIFVLRSRSAGAWTNARSKGHSAWLKENL